MLRDMREAAVSNEETFFFFATLMTAQKTAGWNHVTRFLLVELNRYFVGRCIVIRAVRSLQPGDVVAENYGPIFTKRTLAERQRTLAGRYWFQCTCKACQKDWPRFENLTNDCVRLR